MNELEIIRHPQIQGLSMFFDTLDYRTPHFHPEWELIWVLDQPLAIACGEYRYQALPGDLVLFSPNQAHEFHKVKDSVTFLCLQMSSSLFVSAYPAMERISVDHLVLGECLQPATCRELQNVLLQMMREYLTRSSCYEFYCVGQAYLLFHNILSGMPSHILTAAEINNRNRHNECLNRLLTFVDENYTQKIRLSDFAKMERKSLNYLSGFVKRALGQSFQEYVTTVRFNSACKLIATTHYKMLDVCMASGFSDYRYFSKAFRDRLGITPEEYRRRNYSDAPAADKIHHSAHSLEWFYSRENSLELLSRYSI